MVELLLLRRRRRLLEGQRLDSQDVLYNAMNGVKRTKNSLPLFGLTESSHFGESCFNKAVAARFVASDN